MKIICYELYFIVDWRWCEINDYIRCKSQKLPIPVSGCNIGGGVYRKNILTLRWRLFLLDQLNKQSSWKKKSTIRLWFVGIGLSPGVNFVNDLPVHYCFLSLRRWAAESIAKPIASSDRRDSNCKWFFFFSFFFFRLLPALGLHYINKTMSLNWIARFIPGRAPVCLCACARRVFFYIFRTYVCAGRARARVGKRRRRRRR